VPLILPSDTSSRKYGGSVETVETEAQHSVSCTGDQANDEALNSKKTATASLLGITAQGTLMHSFLGMLLVRFPSIKKKV